MCPLTQPAASTRGRRYVIVKAQLSEEDDVPNRAEIKKRSAANRERLSVLMQRQYGVGLLGVTGLATGFEVFQTLLGKPPTVRERDSVESRFEATEVEAPIRETAEEAVSAAVAGNGQLGHETQPIAVDEVAALKTYEAVKAQTIEGPTFDDSFEVAPVESYLERHRWERDPAESHGSSLKGGSAATLETPGVQQQQPEIELDDSETVTERREELDFKFDEDLDPLSESRIEDLPVDLVKTEEDTSEVVKSITEEEEDISSAEEGTRSLEDETLTESPNVAVDLPESQPETAAMVELAEEDGALDSLTDTDADEESPVEEAEAETPVSEEESEIQSEEMSIDEATPLDLTEGNGVDVGPEEDEAAFVNGAVLESVTVEESQEAEEALTGTLASSALSDLPPTTPDFPSASSSEPSTTAATDSDQNGHGWESGVKVVTTESTLSDYSTAPQRVPVVQNTSAASLFDTPEPLDLQTDKDAVWKGDQGESVRQLEGGRQSGNGLLLWSSTLLIGYFMFRWIMGSFMKPSDNTTLVHSEPPQPSMTTVTQTSIYEEYEAVEEEIDETEAEQAEIEAESADVTAAEAEDDGYKADDDTDEPDNETPL